MDVYERRPDMRKVVLDRGRSINLALSTRGIHALKDVGLYDIVMSVAIPMHGRMIHPLGGELMLQRYGKDDSEVIYAVSRSLLNIALMNEAEKYPHVRVHFNERCIGMNFQTGELQLFGEEAGKATSVVTATVIGTDGSASAIRTEMLKIGRFNFSQHYLDYGYKELTIPAGPNGTFRMEKHALHIWPRKTYMLIALPNVDGSFTCTFFFPFEGEPSFESLNTKERVQQFFAQQFPDAVALMPDFLDDYFSNPTGSMVTIKCSPWRVDGKALLLGDAAHAIVPFFGQGMNCAFEDCTTLDEIVRREIGEGRPEMGSIDWKRVYMEFETQRKVNTDAIADLAVENFVEMRDLVANPKFQLKKKVEQALQARYPDVFIPKYSMVTFHRLPYSVALQRGRIQDRLLDELCAGIETVEALDWKNVDRLLKTHMDSIQQISTS